MKFVVDPKLYISFFVIISAIEIFLSKAQRPYRRLRSTPLPEADSAPRGESDYASRAIIGRVNASGHAAISPRARDIIHNQNTRRLKDTMGGYMDLNQFNGNGAELTINCSTTCTPHEALKQIRLETIKMDILRKLRFSTVPNMTNHRVPDIPFVRNIIERDYLQHDSPYTDDDGGQYPFDPDSENATTLRTIIFPRIRPTSSRDNPQPIIHFSFQSKIFNSEIVNATFGVYVKRIAREPVQLPALPIFLFLHRVKAHGQTEVYLKKRLPLASTDGGDWIQFDIKHTVRQWLEKPEINHGLKISLDDSQRRFQVVTEPQHADEEPYKPFLDVSVREKARSRSRRSASMTCEERSSERRCCRYPLVIDFEAFRWDWVIAPRSYHAYYCSGECPFTYFQTHHTHTHVTQQFLVDPKNGGPCCSPRDLSPISLLYFDSYMNIISEVLPGMVVNKCSCT